MKIAVYKDNLSTGRGADTAVKHFAASVAARGHQTVLFTKPELESRLREPFDILVATGSNEIVDLVRAGYFERPDRAKVVLQLHLAPRGFFKWRHPLRNRAVKKAFNRADAVQLLCGSYESEFRALAPDPAVTTIGNWTEMTAPADHEPSADSTIILYPAAALNKVKNQKLLIRAFATLAAEFPEWKIRLLGKDTTPYAADCRKLITSLRLDGRVEIVGFTTDLTGEYSRAAFIAFPSNLEGFPLAILEAAKFALCAVAQRDLPGATDIIRDRETGLITANSVSAYADALRQLMTDGETRRELGRQARASCAERYARDRILDQWEALFRKTLEA